MIVLVADGVPITAIAAMVGISRRHVYKWAQRFLEQGVEGLADKPGRGRVPRPAPPKEQHAMEQHWAHWRRQELLPRRKNDRGIS